MGFGIKDSILNNPKQGFSQTLPSRNMHVKKARIAYSKQFSLAVIQNELLSNNFLFEKSIVLSDL